ncbi:MAG: archaeosortase/exosortase family protein [Nanoarchaeota archaeon]|nr:archaeosortase/exosortase family protein [Nanoarchaeota archaeon]
MKKYLDKGSVLNIVKIVAIFIILYFEVFFYKYALRTSVLVNSKVIFENAVVLWDKYHIFTYHIKSIFFVFAVIICLLIIRERIMKFKLGEINWTFSVFYLAGNIFAFMTFVIFNMYLIDDTWGSYLLLSIIRYLLVLLIAVMLVLAFFGARNVWNFVREFKFSIIISLLLSWGFLNFYTSFQKIWPYLSWVVAKASYFLLKPIYGDVILKYESTMFGNVYHNIPTVGTSEYAAAIFKPCSGIEGLSLFLLFFTIIVIIDWKKIDWRKLFVLYPLGVAFMFVINILRITFLVIAGNQISPAFALGAFHSNFGWILFAIFFFIFMYFSYEWMKKS